MTLPGLDKHRQAKFIYTLLDWEGREIRPLTNVTGGTITLSGSSRLRASGSIDLASTDDGIEWAKNRVRIEYAPSGTPAWGLGVFTLSAPTRTYTEAGSTWSVELSSLLALPDADCVERTYTVKAGSNLVNTAASILRETGLNTLSVTPSAAQASGDIVYDPGKSKLTIANDLLGAAGYWAAHPDGTGAIHLDPYVRPAARGVAYDFCEGARAIHLPEWEYELDAASVPNKIVLVSEGSQDKPALVGVAMNEDPSSPYSYPSRGRWVTETQTGVEAANQESISSQARRRLIEVSTPSASITLQHMPIPLQPNSVVGFSSQGLSTRGVVREISYTLDPTSLVKTKLLEVTDL